MNVIHPIKIKNVEFPSNIFFAPVNPGWCKEGIVTDAFVDFFVQRAGHLIGLSYVGNIALMKEWGSNNTTAALVENSDEIWGDLADSIKCAGSIPGAQLAWKPDKIQLQREFVSANKNEQIETFKKFYEEFDEYDKVADLYASSIKRAHRLGFSAIQIHAAHGYGLSLLLSRMVSNCDEPENCKGIKVIKKILERLEGNRPILDIRVSFFEGINDDEAERIYKLKLLKLLVDFGFDIISLSNGFYNIDKNMIYPSKKVDGVLIGEAVNLSKMYPNTIWNIAGNMENVLSETLELPENLTLSLGRQLIADPGTIEKLKIGATETVRKCTECNFCHYFSNGFDGITECNIQNRRLK